ncbi:hypothetical protein P4O66_002377 [Electrophorus voltai]|uniref:Uncharacterized protein n=1 Tax=Electrophorus voltai TaxID=2609070 RepID=A0AAD9DSD8_9TELE|nr:hypothetical protein P4O66_002377 [Electrophorus voltai]
MTDHQSPCRPRTTTDHHRHADPEPRRTTIAMPTQNRDGKRKERKKEAPPSFGGKRPVSGGRRHFVYGCASQKLYGPAAGRWRADQHRWAPHRPAPPGPMQDASPATYKTSALYELTVSARLTLLAADSFRCCPHSSSTSSRALPSRQLVDSAVHPLTPCQPQGAERGQGPCGRVQGTSVRLGVGRLSQGEGGYCVGLFDAEEQRGAEDRADCLSLSSLSVQWAVKCSEDGSSSLEKNAGMTSPGVQTDCGVREGHVVGAVGPLAFSGKIIEACLDCRELVQNNMPSRGSVDQRGFTLPLKPTTAHPSWPQRATTLPGMERQACRGGAPGDPDLSSCSQSSSVCL